MAHKSTGLVCAHPGRTGNVGRFSEADIKCAHAFDEHVPGADIQRLLAGGPIQPAMRISGSVALVTGANPGLGLAFAKALLEAGAAKVYAAARNPPAVTLMGVVPLKLDVTSDDAAATAARIVEDVATRHPGRRASCGVYRHRFARGNRANDT